MPLILGDTSKGPLPTIGRLQEVWKPHKTGVSAYKYAHTFTHCIFSGLDSRPLKGHLALSATGLGLAPAEGVHAMQAENSEVAQVLAFYSSMAHFVFHIGKRSLVFLCTLKSGSVKDRRVRLMSQPNVFTSRRLGFQRTN